MVRMIKGNYRIVFLFPNLGVAVKFPIIRIYEAWEIAVAAIKGNYLRAVLPGSISSSLFAGLVANWNEFWFYATTRNPFAQPTYFSLLGLFNIQRYGVPCSLYYKDLADQLDKLTSKDAQADGHHFSNGQNFTLTAAGKLRILDYGSSRTRCVVRKYGAKIHKEFNPSYKAGSNT